MDIKVTTPGEKLKEIRKFYKIKQYELSGTTFTRNMISMIETNKTGLTKSTAEILLKNIRKICKKKSIECDVSLEYLMDPVENQLKNICSKFIELLSCSPEKIFENETQTNLNEIQSLLDKYELRQQKLTLYLKLSKIFDDFNDFYRAYTYSLRAFENYINQFNNPEFIDLIINITYYSNHLKKFNESLNFINLAYTYMNNIPDPQNYKLKFNNAIAYKNLKEYDLALRQLIDIENNFTDYLNSEPKKRINIMMLKANCFDGKSCYIDALHIHKELLPLTENNIEIYLVTLCNIMETYTKMDDIKNIKKYINICTFKLKEYEQLETKKFSAEIYTDIGLGYYSINELEMSKIYYHKTLKESIEHKNIDTIISSMEKLLDIAINTKSENEIDELKNQLIEIISINLMPANTFLTFKLIKYYSSIDDMETIKYIMNFIEATFSKN